MCRALHFCFSLLVVPAIGILLLTDVANRAAAAEESKPAFDVVIDGSSIGYTGEITHAGNAYLFSLADKAGQPLKTLEITSVGGDADAGMDLANWVFDKRLDIHIPSFCGSSCANYVFPAAQHKLLGEKAMLAWHGGATQEDLGEIPECEKEGWFKEYFDCDAEAYKRQMSEMVSALKAREVAFFEKIGVDQRITVLGQKPEFACGDQETYSGWFYSVEDMKRLGVKNIEILGEDWAPEAPSPDIKVCMVTISNESG